MRAVHNDLAEVLFTEDEIAVRVGEMGRAITRDYACTADEGGIVLVSVLRGAAIFMADLARRIELPVEKMCIRDRYGYAFRCVYYSVAFRDDDRRVRK